MSTSPTNHYYASRPSSPSNSRTEHRPTSPPSNAQVRSQAIAKLKRAASLPRTPTGRRPSLGQQIPTAHAHGPPPDQPSDDYIRSFDSPQAGPSVPPVSPGRSDDQEILSPSPIDTSFDHANIYPSPMAAGMQRSASAASSYHMTTQSHLPYSSPMAAPYYTNTPPAGATPDCAAMQLAQSYLPSLTPTGLSPNPYPHSSGPVPGPGGRNTPSPLPTLGELRTLQRSNSNAARAKAMSKLTGGRSSPWKDEHALQDSPSRAGVSLQRAGTLGAPRMLGMPIAQNDYTESTSAKANDDVSTSFIEPRPRLQRSFTVSSSNMGEERRSAVGRRMVERLAERKAARQKEEEEVRRLWEERRAAPEAVLGRDVGGFDPKRQSVEESVDVENGTADNDLLTPADRPSKRSFAGTDNASNGHDLLVVPDRSVSRGTMLSTQEPFEYESHLRRSLSSRTARGAVGTVAEPIPAIASADEEVEASVEQLEADAGPDEGESSGEDAVDDDSPLLPPQPSFATPTRYTPHSSTSTQSTMQGSQSPGSSTLSGLDSMMFVVGGTGGPGVAGLRGIDRPVEHNWPSEVEGSDWGTPAKEHQATFTYSPALHTTSAFVHQHDAGEESHPNENTEGDQISPPSRGSGRPDSAMSWEEVGGKEDQETRVPTDINYHKKSGSISAKIGRTVKQAMRKRSQSRSSVTSSNGSPPTSPRHRGAGASRRGSESSVSPSRVSVSRSMSRNGGQTTQHQPSVSSLAPSIAGPSESSATSVILQHQLSNDPSQVSFLPRANLSDPRIHSSKLSPFPGMAQLEARKNSENGSFLEEPPKLLHQVSDSVVPSLQRSSSSVGGVGGDSIYALPLPQQDVSSRRASTDSVTKRRWLSKAFGQQLSPRSSGSLSRKNSTSVDHHGDTNTLGQGAMVISSDIDPFAAPPPPPATIKPIRHRSISPSVSVVPEGSEEGSRNTRFTATRGDVVSSVLEEEPGDEAPEGDDVLPQKSMDVLSRMDEVLALGPDDPDRPDILDDPPRKLLLASQVLQVVNVHTVKDRYLFLFNDILVIAKPIITHGVHATLDMRYIVKSIVSLDKLAISGFGEEPTTEPERHPVVTNFIQRFAEDPSAACSYLVERSTSRVDSMTLASLIFKTPELDKAQVGHLLAGNEKLINAFIDRFHFTGVRIDQALRMFLLSLRLPTEPTSCERLLQGFARRYHDANQDVVTYHRDLAVDLVFAIMQFNDALYSTFGFALPNHAITRDTFLSAFQSKDPRNLVSVTLLSDIYASIRSAPLVQALSADESALAREVSVTPSRIPPKLTYNAWSDKIYIRIPSPDPRFQIRLLGEGLEFDPPVLDYTKSNEGSFRVRGVSLGTKSLLFDRVGTNAALYAELGNTRYFTVERAFMRNTFHVAFVSHTGLKRKYCFSVQDPEVRARWGKTFARQIRMTKNIKSQPITGTRQQIRQTAEAVSIQVLRDALIPPDDKLALTSTNLSSGIKSLSGAGQQQSLDNNQHSSSNAGGGDRRRSGSVSVAYTQHAMKEEYDLGPLQATRGGNPTDRQSGMVDVQTGKELVLLCRQNSLMPGLLELLQAGKGADSGEGGGGSVRGIDSDGGLGRTGSGRSKGVRV